LEKKCSIIVVGGGPCGSFSAFSAAKAGAKVVVCEEHNAIGVPSHCAGHLSLSGLKRLGLFPLPKKVVENQFRSAVFYSPCGNEFSIRLSSPVTCAVDRELFDKHVAELAIKAGVEYLLSMRVESLVLANGFVKGIVVSRKGENETLTPNIVIDAEGVSSSLLKKAGYPTLNRSAVVNAVHAEVDNIDDVESDVVEVYFGRKYAPGLYAWIIPRRDGSAKIGLATKTSNPKEYLQRFMHNHPIASKKLKRSRMVKGSFHPMTLGGVICRTYHNGLLIVGDAASQVKPTTGGGIIFGLLCSKIAGEVAAKAVMSNDYSEEFLSQYQSRWKKAIGFELAVMRHLRIMLNRLSDNEVDRLIGLCSRFEVGKILGECDDLDFEGMSLIKMLRHPATLVVSLYSFLASIM